MAVWKQEPIICDPPVEDWEFFQFPYNGNVQRIDAINLPNLSELYLENHPNLTEFPWQDVSNLKYFILYSCGLAELPLWKIPNLEHCYSYDNHNLLSVNAHGRINLKSLDVSYSPLLETLDITGCSGLNSLYLSGLSAMSVVDISTCVGLTSVSLNNCPGINQLATASCPNLSRISLYSCDAFTELDVNSHANLDQVYIYRCESISDIDLSGCEKLDSVYFRYCSLDEAAVDQVLDDLVANGLPDGYLRIDGTNTAAPSDPEGLALKATLISRGWTVYTN
jgi:hypothetical protein